MKKIKVFYMPEQTVENAESFSPSAGKPAKAVESWLKLGMPIEVVPFKPMSRAHIALAHEVSHVQGVLSGQRRNGFGNTLKSVRKSLAYTTGSMTAAALYAFDKREIAVSPTSGFHHAGHDHSGGFCTFNGLVVAAQVLKLYRSVGKVGILDCDQHAGDGTENIMKTLKLDYIKHWSLGYKGPGSNGAEEWLAKFPQILEETFGDVDVLIYQAGADPWINDPLGGRLTKEQLRKRDEIVFAFCKAKNIGCAWNLAGGYSTPFQHVLDIHNNTMIEAAKSVGFTVEAQSVIDDGPSTRFSWGNAVVEDHDHEDVEDMLDEIQREIDERRLEEEAAQFSSNDDYYVPAKYRMWGGK